METAPDSEQRAALAMALRELCERAHGWLRVLLGPDSVAAWIEDDSSPAERTVARRVHARTLLQRYADKLVSLIPGLCSGSPPGVGPVELRSQGAAG